MKISLEFSSMRDLIMSFPKFAELISGEEPTEERFAKALADDCKPLVIRCTPTDGKPFTEEEKEGIQRALVEEMAKTRLPETDPAPNPQSSAQTPQSSAEESEKPKAAKSKAKAEKAKSEPVAKADAKAPGEADVRKVFNALIKNGKRDKLKEILEGFGADNFSGLAANHYADAIEKAEAALKEV